MDPKPRPDTPLMPRFHLAPRLTCAAALALVACGSASPPARATPIPPRAPARVTECGAIPAEPPPATAYAFLLHDPAGRPGHWDPQVPIAYTIDLRQAPAGALALVQQIMGEVSAISGLQLSFAGTYDALGNEPHAPLTLHWSSHRADFAGGENEPGHETTASRATTGGMIQITGAEIEMNAGRLAPSFNEHALTVLGLRHEIGHAIGLQHVENVFQVMNADAADTLAQGFGSGDIAGLWRLGPQAGCLR